MTIERPNLADAFTSKPAAVNRAAGLTGLLPPARLKPPQTIIAPSTAPGESAEPSRAQLPDFRSKFDAPERSVGQSQTPVAVSETVETIVNVGVYLEPDLLDLARAARRAEDTTYDELVVNAFAAIPDEQIEQTFRRARARDQAAGMPARQRRLRGTAGIQIQLRLSNHQRAWLDTKTEALGAPSRSALVATALRLHLAG